MSIGNILNSARTALAMNQTALDTTSNNISNVNTPGYSRQRVNITTGTSVFDGATFLSGGVSVANVERVYDRFLNTQIMNAKQTLSEHSTKEEAMARLETVYTDLNDSGLDSLLAQFFSSLEDVTNDPQSNSARSILIASANVLSDKINSMDDRNRSEIENLEDHISAAVDDINSLSSRIAELNDRILQTEQGAQESNELRDERNRLIEELAEEVDINVLEEDSGMVKILMARGSTLVAGTRSTTLSESRELNKDGIKDILLGDYVVTQNISSGRLSGLMDMRTGIHQSTSDKLELLAATISKEFNILHREGYGLDGETGRDLFNDFTPFTTIGSANTGGGVVSSSINDLSAVTLDDYEIRFSSDTTFNIYNTTDGTTVSTGNAYTSGDSIDFEGLSMVVSDTTASPRGGDSFTVSLTTNAARLFGVAITDNKEFAAASDPAFLPGDNSNVLNMTDLQDAKFLDDGISSFSDFFKGLVSDVGGETYIANINVSSQEVVLSELEGYRDSITSVSMDEEGVNLIKFQHAYEAAARVVSTVDQMFETILRLR